MWELEKTPEAPKLDPADEAAVHHFEDTHIIAEDGRYKVRLPKCSDVSTLGQSRQAAYKRFIQNERSLEKRGKLSDFNTALQEYLDLGHAEKVPSSELSLNHYYLPVHGVFKSTSTTTKVRPVFEASAKSSTGVSLNDLLYTGLNHYPLLSDILLRFSTHKIGFSADISKMFREVWLHEDERDFHCFLLRTSDGAITDCRMKRLTFRDRSSPLLATKVSQHLADQHKKSHPEASHAIKNDFYVDDYIAGADTAEEAQRQQKQLCNLLSLAGMTLRKWRTSDDNFRQTISPELVEMEYLNFPASDNALKALGIHWNVSKDDINVATPSHEGKSPTTKRMVASITVQVFDVLGFFAPATIQAKILLQHLWQKGIGWDQEIPKNLQQQWDI